MLRVAYGTEFLCARCAFWDPEKHGNLSVVVSVVEQNLTEFYGTF